ncbi:type II toxin-antitoxin system VapC family toxin [Geodermatophilus sp. CPCC 205506]|uniref:type II toxin-antitoxin system VapC family toxin n=1 Tax=Geodermatophilus sp. CPCC 205506 TaxID=2936596 RepID=UPI003EEE885C
MTVVVDASAVVAALVDDGPDGEWAAEVLSRRPLAAPAHLFVEASNVLRRSVLAGHLSRDVATLAHHDLAQLRVTTFDFEPLAARIWALYSTVTAYDAAYVALAEELDAPLVTLDRRLARATGPTCRFLLPD